MTGKRSRGKTPINQQNIYHSYSYRDCNCTHSGFVQMDGDVRRRAACDRCHTQKLRCPRRPGVDVCDRCIKARTSCVFSPFRQKKEPDIEQDGMKSTANPQVSVINNVGNEAGRNNESATIVHRSKRKRTPSQPKILCEFP